MSTPCTQLWGNVVQMQNHVFVVITAYYVANIPTSGKSLDCGSDSIMIINLPLLSIVRNLRNRHKMNMITVSGYES